MKILRRLSTSSTALALVGTAAADFGPQHVIMTEYGNANCVYATDLDGDGDADVLRASSLYSGSASIAWYENLGCRTFGPQQVIATDRGGDSVYATDLDGDGDADVLSASYTSPYGYSLIAWHENLGGGTFGPQQVIDPAQHRSGQSIYAADLDGDGDADVLSASPSLGPTITWYQNEGDGTFGPQRVIDADLGGAESVYTTDLDGDGDADVLAASTGLITWYENRLNIDGTFGPRRVITNQVNYANSVYATDLDGDYYADVLSASEFDNKIAWYKNLGGGTFGPQQVIITVTRPLSLYATDLDEDGDVDVLSASSIYDRIVWRENLGNGTFGPEHLVNSGDTFEPRSLYATDLDGDGDSEVLSGSAYDGKVAWYENTTLTGTAGPPSITQHPQSEVICAGQSVTFCVMANGGMPLSYQWKRGTNNIAGATASCHIITSVATSDAGVYHCVVTNSCGSVASNAATLAVLTEPPVTDDPENQTVCEGMDVTLCISASGSEPLSYQWQKDGVDLVEETDSCITIETASSVDEGAYRCIVSNNCSSDTSNEALIIVTEVEILDQPIGLASGESNSITLSVTATGSGTLGYQWRKDDVPIPGEVNSNLTIDNALVADSGDYTVIVADDCGWIESETAEVVVFGPPTGLVGCSSCESCASNGVSLSWSVPQGATHFQVLRNTVDDASGAGVISGAGWIGASTFLDTTALPGTNYLYWVRAAADAAGSRPTVPSTSASGWRKLAPPEAVSASDGLDESAITIRWDPVEGASFYQVWRNLGAGNGLADALPISPWISGVSWEDFDTEPEVAYEYWINASIDDQGTGNCDFSQSDVGERSCENLFYKNYGNPPAPGLLVLLDRSESMNVLRYDENGVLNGSTRARESVRAARRDVVGFFQDVRAKYDNMLEGSVAIWTFNGTCVTDRSQGFVDEETALAILATILDESLNEGGSPSGLAPLADAMYLGILKVYSTFFDDPYPRYLAVSSSGEESSSSGPCAGPHATSGTDCATGFVYDPEPDVLPWQQKICAQLPTWDVIYIRKWAWIPGPSDVTDAFFLSMASSSGGAYQEVGDEDDLPPPFFGDCNGNGIFDGDEIAAGQAKDCDGNGVPDECDPDCNANGSSDACDIASGTSSDSDGDGVPDECGSFHENYCIAVPNSTGEAAHILAHGSNSIGANDLLLRAEHLPPNQFGIFFYGPHQTQLLFGNGYRCVGGQLFRRAPQPADVNGVIEHAFDYTDYQTGGQITAGATWNFQAWYRDPMAGGSMFNLSEGMAIGFLP